MPALPSAAALRRPAVMVAALALAGFLLLLADLLAGGPLTRIDPSVSRWLVLHRTPAMTAFLLAVTQVHSTLGIDGMLAAAALVLAARGRWRTALWLVPCVQGAMLLNVLLKDAIGRARPDSGQALVHLASTSFPSGHALGATVWWACMTWLVTTLGGRRVHAVAVGVAAAVLVTLTCVSRVYLGAHYLSDVLAGVCEGLAWMAMWVLIAERLGPAAVEQRRDTSRTAVP